MYVRTHPPTKGYVPNRCQHTGGNPFRQGRRVCGFNGPSLYKQFHYYSSGYTPALSHTSTITHQHYHTPALSHTSTITHQHYHTPALSHTSTITHQHYHTPALSHTSTITHQHYHTPALSHIHMSTNNYIHKKVAEAVGMLQLLTVIAFFCCSHFTVHMQ